MESLYNLYYSFMQYFTPPHIDNQIHKVNNIIYTEPTKINNDNHSDYNNHPDKLCVLLCEKDNENYYYVGATYNINTFFKNEFEGFGSDWTKIHIPVKILFSINLNHIIDLDDYVLKIMNKNGINRVRGGSYNNILTTEQLRFINYEIRRRTNKCTRCGRNHSLVDDYLRCDYKKDINGELITLEPINEYSLILKCEICNSKHYEEFGYNKCMEICSKRKEYYNIFYNSSILSKEPWLTRITLY